MWTRRTLVGLAAGAFIGMAVIVLSGCAPPEAGLREDRAAAPIPEIATREDFDNEVLKARGSILVEFVKSPCPSCEVLAPTIDRLAGQYRGRVTFFRVDVDAARALATAHDVHYTPTVFVFRDGRQVIPPLVGDNPESTYRQALDKALAK